MSSARADFSGSLRRHWSSSTDADGLLDLADPALEVLHPVAGDLAGGVPAVGDVAEGPLGGLEVGDRQQRLGLDQELLLHLGVGGELAVLLGVGGVAGAEERVLGAAEPLPELRRRRRAAPGRRPSTPASGRGSGPAVGPQSVESASASASLTSRSLTTRAPSRFSFSSAKCGLRRRVYVVRAVENRCHSSSSVAWSSRGSAFHSSSRSRSRLTPLRQSLPSASLLGLGDDLLLRRLGLRDLLRALGLAGLALLGDHRGQRVEPGGRPTRSPTAWARRAGRGPA